MSDTVAIQESPTSNDAYILFISAKVAEFLQASDLNVSEKAIYNVLSQEAGGGAQLAGVLVSLINNEELSDEAKNIIGSITVQHIFEVISDNLEEQGLLSDEILDIFISVIEDSYNNMNLENIVAKLEELKNIKQIKDAILATDVGKGMAAIFQCNPIYLLAINILATKHAADSLRKYTDSKKEGMIGDLAQMGIQSLLERYSSQKRDVKSTLDSRTQGILTNYTYAAFFLAKQLTNPDENIKFGDLKGQIVFASQIIRIANDLGTFMKDTEQIDKIHNYVTKLDSEINMSILNFLSQLIDEKVVNKESLFCLLKDLNKKEPNIALDQIDRDADLPIHEIKGFLRVIEKYQDQSKRLMHLINEPSLSPYYRIPLVGFVNYCLGLYEKGRDFDEYKV